MYESLGLALRGHKQKCRKNPGRFVLLARYAWALPCAFAYQCAPARSIRCTTPGAGAKARHRRARPTPGPGLFYALLFASGTARAVTEPAGQALLPGLVETAVLPRAIARSSAIWQIAVIAGPALGGAACALDASFAYAACGIALLAAIAGTVALPACEAARIEHLAALALLGASDMVSVNIRTTLVQLATPEAVRGRVAAVNMLFIGASSELGAFESGVAAALFGTVAAVAIGGAGTLAVAALWMALFPALRKADRLPFMQPGN